MPKIPFLPLPKRVPYVEVQGRTGKYRVTVHCECPGFAFRKHCRHIDELLGRKS